MSDYIKREDAVFIVLQQPMIAASAVTEMRQLPGIEIVRCKECKYGDVLDHYESGCCGCKNGLLGYITADDFCSYGERSE